MSMIITRWGGPFFFLIECEYNLFAILAYGMGEKKKFCAHDTDNADKLCRGRQLPPSECVICSNGWEFCSAEPISKEHTANVLLEFDVLFRMWGSIFSSWEKQCSNDRYVICGGGKKRWDANVKVESPQLLQVCKWDDLLILQLCFLFGKKVKALTQKTEIGQLWHLLRLVSYNFWAWFTMWPQTTCSNLV